ncbi:glutathione S-transferase family protein [Pseudolabrys sp. FHR47]|uniref:glutathione S-transferase family protein n=1 Tax=Pseudolabrys sp. FHR47 TaxID=2562284 RepID=UPI0010BF64F5|nr:glutathione S-transferase family protein [Pseudolabrys sp. FHR47]
MSLKLVIGNKNYSSWSLRPWIAMKAAGIAFEEIVIPLYVPGSAEEILKYSPAGKVPILHDGDLKIWDSLSILEYLDEKFPDAELWPKDAAARALARSVSAEMHSGFQALRQHCTMNLWLPPKPRPMPDEVYANMKRIETVWAECRAQYGKGGPFLFGARFGNADAMYAPVVARFNNYGLPVSAATKEYMDAVMATTAWREWYDAAMKETWVMQNNEVDWPLVRGVKVG